MTTPEPHDLDISYLLHEPPCKVILTLQIPGSDPIVDTVNLANEKARNKFVERVCREHSGISGISAEGLRSKLAEIAASLATEDSKPKVVQSTDQLLADADAVTAKALEAMPPTVRAEADAMLLDPKLIDVIVDDIAAAGVVGEQDLALTLYLIGTSRLLKRPLAAIAQGLSSSGKTFVVDRIAKLFPLEATVRATDITANALFYMPTGSLMHKYVVNGERRRSADDEHAEATRAMRQMISDCELRKVVTIKSAKGPPVAMEIWQPGPIAYIETTTRTEIFDEDANRCLLLATNETPEQTQLIVQAQGEAAAGRSRNIEPVIARHHALQRLLKRVTVEIPFGPLIAKALPTQRQEARRAMPQILSMIEASAVLHQRQRASVPVEHGTVIVAILEDYVVARRLLMGPLARSLGGGLAPAVARFAARLKLQFDTEVFTSTNVATHDAILGSRSKANEYLNALANFGVVEQVEPSKGSKPATWKMVGEIPDGATLWLPTVDDLREVKA